MIAAAPDSGCIVPIRYGLLWASANRSGSGDKTAAPRPMLLPVSTRRRVGLPDPLGALPFCTFMLSAIFQSLRVRSVAVRLAAPGSIRLNQQDSSRPVDCDVSHRPNRVILAAYLAFRPVRTKTLRAPFGPLASALVRHYRFG